MTMAEAVSPATGRPTSRGRSLTTQPGRARRLAAKSPDGVLRIGDLATLAGVSVDALRYYERRGLIHPTGRRASGYREYAPEAAGLVRFIKRAQALGFTLVEIEELVHLRGHARQPGAALAAREVAVAKMQDIDERVRQLQALRTGLAELVNACESSCGLDGSTRSTCPIIGALDDPASR